MKVLIIDDSSAVRLMVKEMLESLGHSSEMAKNGREGVEKLKSDRSFDLVLLDWNMPELTGIELLEIHHKEALTTAPIVMMTTESDPAKIVQAVSLGAKEYIMKPFTEDVLESKIKMVGR